MTWSFTTPRSGCFVEITSAVLLTVQAYPNRDLSEFLNIGSTRFVARSMNDLILIGLNRHGSIL